MNNEILSVVGIVLAVLVIAIGAYFLQQWLLLRQFPPKATNFGQEDEAVERLYFEEKLQANYGDELKTTKIKLLLSIPGSQDRIVLLDDSVPFPNLLRCHSNGWMVWRGDLPTAENDAYTHIEWQGAELQAFSASGYLATLDAEKGEILSYEFSEDPYKLG